MLPRELTRGPFTLEEARRAGLDRGRLRGSSWTRIAPAIYTWKGLGDDPMHLLEAARLRLPANAAFSGLTAAWLHGIDVAPCNPIEVTLPDDAGVSARSGLVVRRAALPDGDVATARGLRITSMARTVGDLSARLTLTEAVVIADAALHARRVARADLEAWAAAHGRRRGIRRLRRVIELAEPATESPMESRLRMLLILGGLPRPAAQVSIHDVEGVFIGRPDLYYARCHLGIEYDGDVHRKALTADNRRQNSLLNAGVQLLRFTAADVLGNPTRVVTEVRALLDQCAYRRRTHH